MRNLKAEMLRNSITMEQIANVIGRSTRTVSDKIHGRFPLTLEEALKIRDTFFKGMSIEFLFSPDNEQKSA